jgi:heme/copper-type cytochrome/quinol oxidase subunit 2
MWGNIVTESSFQCNFNVGFSNTKSDILIHLSQWQYWWWFWFVFLWSLYFMIILRVLRFRTLKFQPRVVTSLRPHGKWGDLLVCLIPTVWCINILINSNFLLRLIEWQSESSLFTVRIRGKQWYWIYKFDLKDIGDIMSSGKNIGFNKWYFSTNGSLDVIDDYLKIIQLRSTNIFFKKYWNTILDKTIKTKNDHLTTPYDQIPFSYGGFFGFDWYPPAYLSKGWVEAGCVLHL